MENKRISRIDDRRQSSLSSVGCNPHEKMAVCPVFRPTGPTETRSFRSEAI